jgi:hypothetical protein
VFAARHLWVTEVKGRMGRVMHLDRGWQPVDGHLKVPPSWPLTGRIREVVLASRSDPAASGPPAGRSAADSEVRVRC